MAIRFPPAPMEIAGLRAVIPLTPICSSVTRVTSSVSRSNRYTLLTPESSETKYTHSPCAHHCGLTLLPLLELPSGVTSPDGHAIAPSVYLPNSSWSADDVNRSDVKAISVPPGDHAGCRSEYTSEVSARTCPSARSIA